MRTISLKSGMVLTLLLSALSYGSQPTAMPRRIGVFARPGVELVGPLTATSSSLDILNQTHGLIVMQRVGLPKVGTDTLYDQLRLGDFYTLIFDSTAPSPESLVAAYSTAPDFESVFLKYYYEFAYEPCDELFSAQWSLNNTGQAGGDSGMDIGATIAWDAFRGTWDDANAALVALIDDGVDTAHWDIGLDYGVGSTRDNMYRNALEFNGEEGIDDDHNGFVDDYLGWDFNGNTSSFTVPEDNDVSALSWHGTAMSSLIAGEADHLAGYPYCSWMLAGVSWYSKILPLKCEPTWNDGTGRHAYGALDPDAVFGAIQYAVRAGAKIINASFGHFGDTANLDESQWWAYAHLNGLAVFAAAGNDVAPSWHNHFWPASFPFVFAVGAIEPDGKRKQETFESPGESNYVRYGDTLLWLDGMAPGFNMIMAWNDTDQVSPVSPDEEYISGQWGTSASAALASGTAALVLSRYPWLNGLDLQQILAFSALDQTGLPSEDTPGWDRFHGNGLIRADRAVNMLMTIVNQSPENGAWVPGQPELTWRYVPVVNSYHVQVAYDSSFTQLLASDSTVPEAHWTPMTALPETTLYWRARYNVPSGWQPFTNATSMRVDNDEPDLPQLLSPAHGCFYTDSASPSVASFYWSTVESYSPIRYTLKYSTDSLFQAGVRGDSNLVDTFWIDGSFAGNQIWYWQVLATDSAGNSTPQTASSNRAIIAAMVGDVNSTGTITSADIIYLTNYVFKAGPEPSPHLMVGNTNECYGGSVPFTVGSADVITLVNFVFKAGPLPCGLAYPEDCSHD